MLFLMEDQKWSKIWLPNILLLWTTGLDNIYKIYVIYVYN